MLLTFIFNENQVWENNNYDLHLCLRVFVVSNSRINNWMNQRFKMILKTLDSIFLDPF